MASHSLDDLERKLWERFRTPRSAPEPRESLLDKLGLARRDEAGTLRPTVAGVLLASDDRAPTCPTRSSRRSRIAG